MVLRTLLEGGGPCFYNILPVHVEELIKSWVESGIPKDRIMINEAAPEQNAILQGEYLNDLIFSDTGTRKGHFYYSQERLHMRDALKSRSKNAQGIVADNLIREAMTPSSYEDWKTLLDIYPSHVLEVSVYDKCLGDIPDRNALVWEVRMY